jgi:hypothetical protein
MDWRSSLLRNCGPGALAGITLRDWSRLLAEEWREVDLSRLPRVLTITTQSLKNSMMLGVEHRRYDSLLQNIDLQPPLFVLGHWRNGTTHLHQLLAQDTRFASPNSYQASFPHTFLSSEATDSRLLSFFIPKRRPMDNVELSLDSPQEDEFALCACTRMSPVMCWVFPRQMEKFERYLTFKSADDGEVSDWQAAFMNFLKKLQLRYDRPLILKSPPHTARIRLLLQLFPKARFVHIHRNPYDVYKSSRKLFEIMFKWHGLQRPRLENLDDWILRQYRKMYDAFFEDRKAIPTGQFYELSFERLELNPIEEVGKIYRTLGLPDFTTAEPALRKYVDSLSHYRKNVFTELPVEQKRRIASEWSMCFKEWGY